MPLDSQETMGSVPGGVNPQDILTGLTQRSTQINEELLKALPAALKQTAQSSTPVGALPTVTPFQPAQMDNSEKIGAGASYRQSVSNSVKGIANIIGKAEQKHQENQVKILSVDIQRIMEAQDGIGQAQQVLKQDPNNAEAKATYEKNAQIINAMLSDPKRRKQIGKAFDINFVDPSKNDKPEHKAMQDATKSYAEQLQAKTPQKMGPDPQAVAKVQLLTQQAQAIDKMVQATETQIYRQEYLKHLQEAEQGKDTRAKETIESREKIEANKQALATAKLQEDWQKAKMSSDTRLKAASIAASSRLAVADRQIQGRMDAIDHVFKTSGGGVKKIQALNNVVKMYQSKQKAIDTEISTTEQLRTNANPAKVEEYNKYIQTLEDEKLKNQDEQQQLEEQIKVMTDSIGDTDAGDSSSRSSSKSTSRSQSSSADTTIPKPIKSARQYDGSNATSTVKVAGTVSDSDPDHF
jgi:hypothetical protein